MSTAHVPSLEQVRLAQAMSENPYLLTPDQWQQEANEAIKADEIATLKLEWWKLGNKALRAFPSSPRQKEYQIRQADVEARLNRLGVTRQAMVDEMFKRL